MSDSSFEDMFDGFATSLKLSNQKRPMAYPKSTSEMRKHTTFASQGIAESYNGDKMHQYNTSKMSAAPRRKASAPPSRLQLMAAAQKSQFRVRRPANAKAARVNNNSKLADARMFSNWDNFSSA